MGVFAQSGIIREKWFYSDKVVVLGQKWLYLGKSGCIQGKEDVFGKAVVLGQ